MRRGTAAEGATAGAVEIRVKDDEGPWSDYEQISVGNPHEYEQSVDIYLGGVFRHRYYDLRFTNSESTALVALYDDITEVAG